MNGTLLRVASVGADPNDASESYGSPPGVEWCRVTGDPHAAVIRPEARNAFELIEESLRAGRSVFCPFPVAFSPRQVRSLSELSVAQGRILRFSEPYRYLGGFPLLRRLLGGSEPFWQPFYLRSEWLTSATDAPGLNAMAMQDLALYDSVFLAKPRSVSATAFDDERTSGPCAVTLAVEYEHGPPLQCTVSHAESVETHQCVAVASDRMVTLDQRDRDAGLSIAGIERPAASPVLKRLDADVPADSALKAEFAGFVRSAASGDRSFTNAARWLRVSSIWSAARRSIRSGRRVDVVGAAAGTTTPPPLTMIEGGGRSTRTTGPRPALTLVAS